MAMEPPEATAGSESPSCPACGALVPEGARFCDACGHALSKRKRAAAHGAGDVLEERHAEAELARAHLALRNLRAFFLVTGILTVLLLAAVLALRGAGSAALDGEGNAAGVLVAVLVLQSALMGVGAWQVRRHPLPWAIVGASFVTLVAAIFVPSIPSSGFQFRMQFASIFICIAFWAMVGTMIRMRRLLAAFPELRAARALRGEKSTVEESALTARDRERRRTKAKASRRQALVLWSLAGAIAAAVAGGLWLSLRAPPFAPVVEGFERAWESGDAGRLAGFFREDLREEKARGLAKILESRKWTGRTPAIRERRVEERSGTSRAVTFLLDGDRGSLETHWSRSGDRWNLAGLKFPPR